jgi:hypothetical protein
MELFIPLLLDQFLGMEIIDKSDFSELVVRFVFNFLICFYIIRYIYYPFTRRKDYLFTYLIFTIVIFFLCNLLSNVKLDMGFALGLFAVFGLLRYRTDAVPIKEMTYLFIVIGVSIINALANKKVSYAELLFTNLAIVALTYLLEKKWLMNMEFNKIIVYENMELIKPENHLLLLEDIKKRTGIDGHRISIDKVNFLRDVAYIRVYYYKDINNRFADENNPISDDGGD